MISADKKMFKKNVNYLVNPATSFLKKYRILHAMNMNPIIFHFPKISHVTFQFKKKGILSWLHFPLLCV